MSLHGKGAVLIWHELDPAVVQDFYEWHNREHMPERVSIPGFLRGRRYVATRGDPYWFNVYETRDTAVLAGPDYLARLNDPTPWTRRVVPAFRDVSRALCMVAASDATGDGGLVLTARLGLPEDAVGAGAALGERLVPAVARAPGVAGAHLCIADDASSSIETAEKKARGSRTDVPAWTLVVEATHGAALDEASGAIAAALAALGLPAAREDRFVLQHQTAREDVA